MHDQDKSKAQLIDKLIELRQRVTKAELLKTNKQLQREISERKQAEEALRESEEKYRSVIENANVGILIIQDGQQVFYNSEMYEMLEYTEKEYRNTLY